MVSYPMPCPKKRGLRFARWPSMLCMLTILTAPTYAPAAPQMHVLMIAGTMTGLFYECVAYYRSQGVPLNQAVDQCRIISEFKT